MKEILRKFPKVLEYSNTSKEDYLHGNKVLITVLLADLAQYFRYALSQNDLLTIESVNKTLFNYISLRDENIDNVIITGFLESFQPGLDDYDAIRNSLPPKLRKALQNLDEVLSLKKRSPENWFE